MADVDSEKGNTSCVKRLQTFAADEKYTAQEEEIIKTYRKLSARQQAKFLNFIFELEEQTP